MAKKKITRFLAGILCGVMIFTSSGAEQFVYAVQEQSAVEEEGSLIENPDDENEDPQGEETGQTPEKGENPGEEENGDGESSQEGEKQEEESEPEESDSQEDENEPDAEEGISDNSSEKPEEEQDSDQDGEERVSLDTEGNIASGEINKKYGHIKWVIDSEGTLTVTGTGDVAPPGTTKISEILWHKYAKSIVSAKISVSGMKDASNLFFGLSNLISLDVSEFDTSEVTNMECMFYNCRSLTNLDLSGFNTSNVTNMGCMFSECMGLISLDVSGFDTSNVTNMKQMFGSCYELISLDVSGFDTSNVTDMFNMFYSCEKLTNLDVSGFDTSNVTNMMQMFCGCKKLINLDVSGFDTSNVTNMNSMFYDCRGLTNLNVSGLDTSSVTNMYRMFYGCNVLTNVDVSGFDTSGVQNMSYMFGYCKKLTNLDVSRFDTSSVTDMSYMFGYCKELTNLDVSRFDTSSVQNMSHMFSGCNVLSNLDVSGFDTCCVTDMSDMFSDCSGLTNLDVSEFDTSGVTDMSYMFAGCSGLTYLDVSEFDTSGVTNMYGMFYGCEGLTKLDLSSFDMESATLNDRCGDIFTKCNELNTIQAPYNVKCNILLPGTSTSKWYKSDGTVMIYLPKDLSGSIILGKDYIPRDADAYGQYMLTVYDEDTGLPIPGVTISDSNVSYKSKRNGVLKLAGKFEELSGITLAKDGYETKKTNIKIDSKGGNKVYLKKNNKVNVPTPDISAKIPLKAEIDGGEEVGKIPWLDTEFEIELYKNKNKKNGLETTIPVNVEYDKEKDTMKVTFGVKQTDEDGATSEYDAMKNLCGKIGNSKSGKAVKNMLDKKLFKQKGELGITIESSIMGYFEMDCSTHELIESGAYVALSGQGELTYRPSFALGIFYVKASLELSAQGTLSITCKNQNIVYSGTLELGQAIGIGAGAGGDLLGVELGVTGKLTEIMRFPWKNAKESFEVQASVAGYVDVRVLGSLDGFPKSFPPLLDYTLWPEIKNNKEKSVTSVLQVEDMKFKPRNYVTQSVNENDGGSTKLDADNIYPDGTPEMVQISDGTLLAVWVADLGTKSEENRTTLVYSVRTGDQWSSPKAVCETGRGDFYPKLMADGDRAYLVWTNLDHEMETDATIEEMLAATDVYYAVFENGSFGIPELITESGNGRLETLVNIAADGESQTVVWVENSENNFFLLKGKNSIYQRTCENGVWGQKKCLAGELNDISSLAAAYVDGKLSVAYTMDLDDDCETTGDTEVFLYRDGETKRITSDNCIERSVAFLGNTLYWCGPDEIMQAPGDGNGSVSSTGVSSANSYRVMEKNGEKAILVNAVNGFESTLYMVHGNEETFSEAIPVTDGGKKISDYAAAYLGNGEVAALTFEREVLENPTETDFYGNTNLRVYEKLEAASLVVDSIYIEEEKVAPGATIPVELSIYNGASRDLTGVEVTVTCGDSVVADHVAVSCQIGAGESGTVTTECKVGDLSEITMLRAQVIPKDYEDTDLSDNTAEVEIGSCDLALQDTEITLQDNGTAVLVGKLANSGFVPAQNVRLRLLAGGYEGEEIFSDTYGSLAAGAENMVTCTIPASCLDFKSTFDGKYIYFSCDTDTQERRYDNNSGNLVVFPRAVTGIELTEETLSLSVKSRGNLHAHVTPADAFEQEICYVSDNTMVAVADDKGVVTAVGAGTATITAITADGGFAKSCEVTVTEAEAGETVYGLDQHALSLEKGKTGQLAVKDAEGNAPADALKWVSSDETIATVDENGLVTAIAAGSVDVSVSIGENFFDSCVVEVTDKEIQALLLDENSIALTEGETRSLQVSIVPKKTVSDKTLQTVDKVPHFCVGFFYDKC